MYDPDGNIISSGYVPHGFVGYFDLFTMPVVNVGLPDDPPNPPLEPPLGNTFADSIYLMVIPETDSIMQLVAHHDYPGSYDVFLMAVGYTSWSTLSTCVVELTKLLGTGETEWMLNIVQPECAETDEYMTDITLVPSEEECGWDVIIQEPEFFAKKAVVDLSTYEAEIICEQDIDQ